jgi:glutathione synthase/RimK-type ligase-like ATP-grasp enzyme
MAQVLRALKRLSAPFVFADQDSAALLRAEAVSAWEPGGRIRVGDTAIDLSAVDAVYLRPHASGFGEFDRLLYAWADVTPAMVVNRPAAMSANNSKPYQARLIERYGFATPETLVTTDPQAAAAFRARHGELVYKSISGVRSIVARLRPEREADLADVCFCPTQFQEYVPGVDHRVHVVGADVFACRIESDADDYRYARSSSPPRIVPLELPGDLAMRLVEMVDDMDLLVAGVDLRQRSDGRWVCFEVNPSPGFSYYEEATGQPIAETIGRLLAGAPRSCVAIQQAAEPQCLIAGPNARAS